MSKFCTLYRQVRIELQELCKHLPIEIFRPYRPWREIAQLFARWAVLGFLGSFMVFWLQGTFWRSIYLEKAASQGVSPELWNVIGGSGIFLVALSFLFAKVEIVSNWISRLASGFLMAAFEMGLLGFGIMAAQAFSISRGLMLESWQTWFFGVALAVLFGLVLLINMVLWYLARMIYDPDNMKAGALLRTTAGFPLRYSMLASFFFMAITAFAFSRAGAP